MLLDLNSIRNAKKAPSQNVVDLFNSEEYSTKVIYKKEVIEGKTYVRGVFSSVKKGDSKDEIDQLENDKFYYSHNQSDPLVLGSNNKPKQNNLTLIAIVSILVSIELIKYFLHTLSHNDIESKKCQEVKKI
jgi:hypothetical protein